MHIADSFRDDESNCILAYVPVSIVTVNHCNQVACLSVVDSDAYLVVSIVYRSTLSEAISAVPALQSDWIFSI